MHRPQLPPYVDVERITARADDGELVVTIPKTEQPRQQQETVIDVM